MIRFLDSKILRSFLPILIFLFAFTLRVYGINWDQNQHLHPDERFLTMTVGAMSWPKTFSEYINPSLSKLNPYNINSTFFVYGTFPTTLVKYFSGYELFDIYQYNNITITGRLLSAIFDIGVVVLIFFISSLVFGKNTGLLASFLYSISVLPIQLSHFFAVDTFLNFFLVLSFFFLIKFIFKNNMIYLILLGLSFGLALACKISALYFLPVILLGLLFVLLKPKNILLVTCYMLLIAVFTLASFRIFDPHVFSGTLINPKISPQFIQNIKELKSMGVRDSMFPPAIQWQKITPIIFPLKNMILWGLGLPLGILSVVAVIYSIYTTLKNLIKNFRKNNSILSHFLIVFWIIFLFFYQGIQFTPSMRYFLPIYPFLSIILGSFLFQCFKELKQKIGRNSPLPIYLFIILFLLVWPISFLSIYTKPHSRIMASGWIYKNIPSGSTLSCDAWDDCLPLSLENVGSSYQYKILSLEPFAPDSSEKWKIFNEQLNNIDYLVLSSNRVWGSIPKVPEKYPLTSKFYNDLFAGKLNFVKVAEITSYPTIPILNIPIPDQSSEEAFTVYDHPKVLIFQRNKD